VKAIINGPSSWFETNEMALNYAQIDSLTQALLQNAKALIFEAETLNNIVA
jgi:hypothetical protein